MKWEYRTIIIPPSIDMSKRMNELGALGWELVTITSNDRMIFKRQVGDKGCGSCACRESR